MCYQTHIRVHRAQPKDLFIRKYFFKFKQLFFFVYNQFLRVSRLNHKFFLERKRFEFDKKNRWCRFVHQPMYLGNLEIIRAAILTWFTIRQPLMSSNPYVSGKPDVYLSGRPFRVKDGGVPGEAAVRVKDVGTYVVIVTFDFRPISRRIIRRDRRISQVGNINQKNKQRY